jgi:hypothetical protein
VTSAALEKRLAALEQQVARLQREGSGTPDPRGWVDDLYGKFAKDPIFERAMKLGRQYRKSLRPRAGRGKSGR